MIDHEHDTFIAAIAKELREPVRLDPGLDARIMRALEPAVISLDSRRPHVPWYRRTFALPAGGLAAAAAVAGIAAIGTLVIRNDNGSTTGISAPAVEVRPATNSPVDPASILVPTQFILPGAGHRAVAVVGDFNDWDPSRTPMEYDSAVGAWQVTVDLPPGLHQYQFLINGTERVNDPAAPQVNGDFGSANSVITVRVPR